MMKRSAFFLGVILTISTTCLWAAKPAGGKGYAQAERVLSAEKGGNWKQQRTWEDRKVPAGFEIALIGRDSKVVVDSAVKDVNGVNIGSAAPDMPTLTIQAGGALKVDNLFVVWTTRTNSTAAFELKGGALQVGSPDFGEACMVVGTGMTFSGKAVATFSGGKYTGGLRAGTTQNNHTGKLVFRGSDVKVECGKYGRSVFELEQTGSVDFILDEKGIATLDYSAGRGVSFASGSQITVNGAAYTGGTKTFTLIAGPANFTDNGANFSVVHFPETLTASLQVEPHKKGKALVLKIKAVK